MENELKEPVLRYNFITQEAYLEMERSALEKHEYYNGEVFAMSGASLVHNNIFTSIFGKLFHHLSRRKCTPYGSDLRIHIPENTLYTYPDISIICGEPELTDVVVKDTIVNPSVIIEILSPSTKEYDRGTKAHLYRSIKTLQEYILIDSTNMQVETFVRQTDDSWLLREINQPESKLEIATIGFSILLKDIYQSVAFED